MEDNLGPVGRLRDATEGASTIGQVLAEVPGLLTGAERAVTALAEMARSGVRLDEETVRRLATEDARRGRWRTWAIWLGALALAAIAARQILGLA
jgi:ubiquinone biosynthesis protein